MASDEDSSIISLTSSVADDAEGSHNGDEDSDGDLARGLARVAIDGDEPEVIDLISDDDERAEPTKAPAADEGSSDGSPRPDIVVRRRRVVESSDESEPPASPRASEHDSCSGQENAAATPPGGTAVVRRRRVVESSDDSDSPVCPRAGEDQDDSDEESGPATPALETPRRHSVVIFSSGSESSSGARDAGETRVPRAPCGRAAESARTAALRGFARTREAALAGAFDEFDAAVFGGRLRARVTSCTWNKRLTTTAGRCVFRRAASGTERVARVELAEKVVDCEARLRETLLHELCHVAAWCLDGVARPPHGEAFRAWGARATRAFPALRVTTCHTFEIAAGRFRYECAAGCGRAPISRHSRSIDTSTARCCGCAGALALTVMEPDGRTPAKARPPSAFSLFTKRRFADLRREMPGASHGAVMARLGEEWRHEKAAPALAGD